MDDIDVDALLSAERQGSVKMLCYKTVEVFAGITQRKLWLKDASDGRPKTNGYLIEVPFGHPRAYQYTEHELSHILFQSDMLAKSKFVEEYSKKIGQVAEKSGAPINERMLRGALDGIVNVLDDERVISLWGLLYRGSEAIMRRMKFDEATPHLDLAHEGFLNLFICLASRNEVPQGKLDRYRPYMVEALRKVHLRDYFGALVTAKWLVVQLVSEIIRESRGEPPPVMPGLMGRLGTAPNPFAQDPTNPPGGGSGAAQDDQDGQGLPRMPWEPEGGSAGPETPSSGHGQDAWQPPEVNASAEDRSKALQEALDRMGQMPEDVKQSLDDVSESKFKKRGEESMANRRASAAIGTDVKDADKLESALEASASHMIDIVNDARQAVRNVPNHDDLIRQDAYAKVIFTDVRPSEHRDPHLRLEETDEDTVQRLRATFHRVMGRRANTLEESGAQIDIPAYIERRLTRDSRPIFRVDCFGRGFRTLVLIDRSSSMEGERTHQAERSCQIITRALAFPFVRTAVWGFQSWNDGEVNITRFQAGAEVFESESAAVGGITPLHTAIRVGLRELEDGTDRKHLFVISDGFPVFSRKGGQSYGTKTLMGFVRSNIMAARTKGVGVTGVMIGGDVSAKGMEYMFGPSKYWRVLNDQTFSTDLVQLVVQSFVDYLRVG